MGEWLAVWTIRAALLCLAAVLARRWVFAASDRERFAGGWPHALGAALAAAHVLLALAVFHDFSHAAAVRDTARRTRELLGVEVGVGVWFNYAFVVAWFADVALEAGLGEPPRGAGRAGPASARVWRLGLEAYLVFIAFNGAVVFVDGAGRGAALAITAALAIAALARAGRRRAAA